MQPTQTEENDFLTGGSSEPPKPMVAGVYRIAGVDDAADTQSGRYKIIKIKVEGVNGTTRRIFPTMLFRTEWFTKGFSPAEYTNYSENPNLATVEEGKRSTIGESMATVYRMHALPVLYDDKGVTKAKGCTTLMALVGGTFEAVQKYINPELRKAYAAAGSRAELTKEEITEVLRAAIEAAGNPEVMVVLKQSRDRNGDLSDNYEVADWVGPFTAENDKKLRDRAAKTAKNDQVNKRIVIGYNV